MYKPFDTVTLKSGEAAEIGVVVAPDAADPRGVKPLLGHKPDDFAWHIERAIDEPLDGLETRFYIASLDGRAVSNVMLVEHGGVGILGHVFTLPEQRRKGLCEALFGRLMPDFRERGGLRLILGTGYDSPPYWIYHRHGFRSIVPESGFMKYDAVDDFDARWYDSGPARVERLTWRHWGPLATLFADDFGEGLQALGLGAFGPTNLEGPSLKLFRRCTEGDARALVLETEPGAVVGLALLQPDSRWRGAVWLLDLVAHPRYRDELPRLLEAMAWPDAKMQCHVPAAAVRRRAVLEAAGWDLEGRLADQLPNGDDVLVFGRRG